MKFKNGQKPAKRINARVLNKPKHSFELDYSRTHPMPHRYDEKSLRGTKPFKTFKALG
ncbi:hypothetical protein ICN48_05635 [Polynucleobacter sp. JS-Safj-400b-B2]|uniref:hypothetical protein n=1 Tax=Polynucleobacter sp. JS-Safj-400b-B2 TaxID=2576921 RepID=UPI001C0C95CC|nr:hypothetical protein [Polynucleobacter sp. JS-Safj-400b-B2]MBU3625715.1 hypothetical protein [Polynucleobacter sp. JS-Safj-400b-B2]